MNILGVVVIRIGVATPVAGVLKASQRTRLESTETRSYDLRILLPEMAEQARRRILRQSPCALVRDPAQPN